MYSNLLWEKEEEEDEENERDLFLVFRRFEGKNSSPAGNRTPVSRVTRGDTYHYTTEDTYVGRRQWILTALSLTLDTVLCPPGRVCKMEW